MTLRESLSFVQRSSPALIHAGGICTYDDVLSVRNECADDASRSCMILPSENIEGFVRGLIHYDGLAEAIFLKPHGLSSELEEALMRDVLAAGIGGQAQTCTALDAPQGSAIASRAGSNATRWLLATSGTTSRPKLVGHTFAGLHRRLSVREDSLGAWRWGLVYDAARFAGLQVLLQALLCGSIVIAPAAQDIDGQLDFLAQHGCNALSATPTFYRQACMTGVFASLPLKQLTLGGEAADQRILTTLRGMFPTARLTHIYASTEAGVGFAVSDGQAGFPYRYLDDAPKGIRLQIRGDRLFVHNPDVDGRYCGSEKNIRDSEGWVDTGDVVEVRNERVYCLGRASGVINVGGNKVHPEEVESVLLEHPDVIQARVYSKRNAMTGAIVVADVVLGSTNTDRSATLAGLVQHLHGRLPRYKVPALLNPVATISLTAAAKINRLANQ